MDKVEKLTQVRQILEASKTQAIPQHLVQKAIDLISDVIIDLRDPFVDDGAWQMDAGYYCDPD